MDFNLAGRPFPSMKLQRVRLVAPRYSILALQLILLILAAVAVVIVGVILAPRNVPAPTHIILMDAEHVWLQP